MNGCLDKRHASGKLTESVNYAFELLMWHPNAKLPRSTPTVLNGRCRARLDMSRSSLGVVLRGLPARQSVTFPV